MKAWCIAWVVASLVCVSTTHAGGKGLMPRLGEQGHVFVAERETLVRKLRRAVTGMMAAVIIACTTTSCDTATTHKILTDLQQPEAVLSAMQENYTYYIIDNRAWPHTAVAVSLDNGSLDLVHADSISIPMDALHDTAVLGHEAIGLEVSYIPPPDYESRFVYIHHGRVTNFYRDGYVEVVIDSFSTQGFLNRKSDKQLLLHTYKILVDESLSEGLGGIIW